MNKHPEKNSSYANYRIMMSYPRTSLAKTIGAKWFLPIEKLAETAGVSVDTIRKALRGTRISADSEQRIRKALKETEDNDGKEKIYQASV